MYTYIELKYFPLLKKKSVVIHLFTCFFSRDRNHVIGLLKRFPNMDMEALKAKYPDVDIDRCKASSKARGHYVPE